MALKLLLAGKNLHSTFYQWVRQTATILTVTFMTSIRYDRQTLSTTASGELTWQLRRNHLPRTRWSVYGRTPADMLASSCTSHQGSRWQWCCTRGYSCESGCRLGSEAVDALPVLALSLSEDATLALSFLRHPRVLGGISGGIHGAPTDHALAERGQVRNSVL